MNTLAAAASGDLLLLNDVRQPLSRNTVRDLTRTFTDPAVGCATGRLVLTGGAGSGVYWRYEEWIRRQESRFRGVVGMTGPLGMVRRADFIPVPTDIILDDVWLPMSLVLAGKRVVLVPTAEAHDTAFADEREFSRKVRTLAGNYQLFAKLPQLLVPFINPIWFETFSHKLMRLSAPWMLLLLLGSSLLAATGDGSGLVRALVIAQLLFYGMAAVGPKGGRLAGVARTFVVLNVAAIVGLGRFLTGRQRITWKTGRESGSAAASSEPPPMFGYRPAPRNRERTPRLCYLRRHADRAKRPWNFTSHADSHTLLRVGCLAGMFGFARTSGQLRRRARSPKTRIRVGTVRRSEDKRLA